MASHSVPLLLFSSLLLHLISATQSQPQRLIKPSALVLSIHKDSTTQLHIANITKRTPRIPLSFVIDLNGRFLWANCQHNYLSSTYRAPLCHSSQCSLAGPHSCRTCSSSPPRPGCHNHTCGVVAFNPLTHTSIQGELAEDALSIQSTDGSNPRSVVTVPRFLFTCVIQQKSILTTGIQGFAGFGPTQIALPTQLASHFGFQRKFALCFGRNDGVVFFGGGPYVFFGGIDVSKSLTHTPLTVSPQGEYHIGVRAIKINNKFVPFTTSLLGGTKISTVDPYTVLQSNIFQAVAKFYTNELSSVPRVAPVAPFGLCFNSSLVSWSRMGPGVPDIDLVLQGSNVVWKIYAANVVVRAGDDALCLAFVDGGKRPRAAITIGAFQMEDNLLQFDLASSILGFSSSLLFQRTNCANFNFTSKA